MQEDDLFSIFSYLDQNSFCSTSKVEKISKMWKTLSKKQFQQNWKYIVFLHFLCECSFNEEKLEKFLFWVAEKVLTKNKNALPCPEMFFKRIHADSPKFGS